MSVRDRDPDDPRVAAFTEELVRARVAGITDEADRTRAERFEFDGLLIWSGRLPAGVDESAAVRALVQERWWHFVGGGDLEQVGDEEWVIEHLTWLLGHEMTYDVELMPRARASELAESFLSLLPARRRWFTNVSYAFSKQWNESPPAKGWTAMTDFTFDQGVIAAADGRAWIAWFTAED